MRKLDELVTKFDAISLIIDEDVVKSFVEDCNRLGFAFRNSGPITPGKCGLRMALHVFNKTIWYIGGMIWHYSFTNPAAIIQVDPGATTSISINYKAFVTGEPNYVYKTPSKLFPPD